MALQLYRVCSTLQCFKAKGSYVDNRLAINYQPTIWSHDSIRILEDTLSINFKEVKALEKKVLAVNVSYENGSNFSTLQLLEHIDDLEKLGLGYRYQNHIRRTLNIITSRNHENIVKKDDSLHEACLRFRLLREHGYNVSQDFLRRFKDGHGGFVGCLQTDVKGLISLYEASHLAFEEERDLGDAKLFATKHLLKLKGGRVNESLELINRSLELSSYRRMLRLQARWYIDAYSKRKNVNIPLLDLATSDFNMVQSAYKKELKEVSRWWNDIGLARNLSFVRDRLVECFFWTVGMVFEPQYASCRVGLTKVSTLITVIDDIYDVYGSLDELEMFTDVVKRWDIDAMKQMPEYLQLGFQALYDTINDLGSKSLIEEQENITPILVKMWGELLEAFFIESRWAYDGYIPTLEDYLDNAWRSVSGMVLLTHGYLLINQETNNKSIVDALEKYHDLFKFSSVVFRLCNDLGTSSDEIERGKSTNAISCYMHEKGVCEEVAREYIKTLIDQAWQKLMKAQVACSQGSADSFTDMAINLARISQCTYQYGDGHGAPDARAKTRVVSVIIDPIIIVKRSTCTLNLYNLE